MAIFNSYVKLPEGISFCKSHVWRWPRRSIACGSHLGHTCCRGSCGSLGEACEAWNRSKKSSCGFIDTFGFMMLFFKCFFIHYSYWYINDTYVYWICYYYWYIMLLLLIHEWYIIICCFYMCSLNVTWKSVLKHTGRDGFDRHLGVGQRTTTRDEFSRKRALKMGFQDELKQEPPHISWEKIVKTWKMCTISLQSSDNKQNNSWIWKGSKKLVSKN